MAKAQKPKSVEPEVKIPTEGIVEVNEEAVTLTEESPVISEVVDEKPVSDELVFLQSLLETQLNGKWHGPAAGLIKQRIAQIKGK